MIGQQGARNRVLLSASAVLQKQLGLNVLKRLNFALSRGTNDLILSQDFAMVWEEAPCQPSYSTSFIPLVVNPGYFSIDSFNPPPTWKREC